MGHIVIGNDVVNNNLCGHHKNIDIPKTITMKKFSTREIGYYNETILSQPYLLTMDKHVLNF